MVERFVVVDDDDDDRDEEQDERDVPERRRSGNLSPFVRKRIMIALAQKIKHQIIADENGVALQTVRNIKYLNKDRIREIEILQDAKISDLFHGKKARLVGLYEKQIAELEDELSAMRTGDRPWDGQIYAKLQAQLTTVIHKYLEATGGLPNRGGSGGGEVPRVQIVYEGLDPSKMPRHEGDPK